MEVRIIVALDIVSIALQQVITCSLRLFLLLKTVYCYYYNCIYQLLLYEKHENNIMLKLFSDSLQQNTMNQEKLAKLQAQVRIGGKVQSPTIYGFTNVTKSLVLC